MMERFVGGAAVGGLMMGLAVVGVTLSGIETIPGLIAFAYVCVSSGIAAAVGGAGEGSA